MSQHRSALVRTCGLLLAAVSGTCLAQFRVGADAACTHSSLFAALIAAAGNGPDIDTIRIANNLTYSNTLLSVSGHSLRLVGGYTTCAAAAPSGRTTISGPGSVASAISTSGKGPRTLEIENIEIADSPLTGANGRRGGGLRIEGGYTVTLRNTTLRDNVAGRGGGIYIGGTAATRLVLAAPTNHLNDNTARVAGGGIYCTGPARIDWQVDAGAVFGNRAEDGGDDPDESGSGGGVALFDGCEMVQRGGHALSSVYGNDAVQYGGGYYLRNLARLHLLGNGEYPARVVSNRTTLITGATPGAGGGIAIRDPIAPSPPISEVLAENAWIEDNYAWQGSGVALLGGGRFIMRRTLPGNTCHDMRFCSSLSFNGMDAGTMGARAGALWAQSNATVDISGTYIQANSASVGSALWTNGSARTTLDSVVLSDNFGAAALLDVRDVTSNGFLHLAWSTVNGNDYTGSPTGARILTANMTPSINAIRIYGTLLAEPLMFGVSADILRSDCVLRDPAMQPLAAGGNITRQGTLASPYGLVAPASGNFHLANGDAVPADWCDGSLAPRLHRDIAGFDTISDAIRNNLHGIHDLGAHEFQDIDLIFANGFQ